MIELVVALDKVIDIVGDQCRAVGLACGLDCGGEVGEGLDKGYFFFAGYYCRVVADDHAFVSGFAEHGADARVSVLDERTCVAVEVN